ncbi:MAG TPA: hypothetical protein VNK50_10165 [Calidithermus sp.]|nr:hypothetical protein [Calidithermus sp.]
MSRRRSAARATLLALIALSGCTTTRVGRLGTLADDRPLVTLIVTEDRQVVLDECQGAPGFGRVLGCQRTDGVRLPDGAVVRTMKVVRYTDTLPSPLAFEIDLHELCHVVAALQEIDDPCHADGALLRQAAARRPPLR